MSETKSKTLTIRLTPHLFEAARDVAKRRDVSLNALVSESLEAAIRDAQERARFEEYTLLGQDVEGCDVTYALAAQTEVMTSDQT